MASTEGGVEIEKVAEETPELIHKAAIDPLVGPQAYQGRELAFKLGLSGDQIRQFVKIFMGLGQMFAQYDLALLEINPLVITGEGNLLCLDGKIRLDGGREHQKRGKIMSRFGIHPIRITRIRVTRICTIHPNDQELMTRSALFCTMLKCAKMC